MRKLKIKNYYTRRKKKKIKEVDYKIRDIDGYEEIREARQEQRKLEKRKRRKGIE